MNACTKKVNDLGLKMIASAMYARIMMKCFTMPSDIGIVIKFYGNFVVLALVDYYYIVFFFSSSPFRTWLESNDMTFISELYGSMVSQ